MEGWRVTTQSLQMAVASDAAWTFLPSGPGQGHGEHSALQARQDLRGLSAHHRTVNGSCAGMAVGSNLVVSLTHQLGQAGLGSVHPALDRPDP
jgi:hypothetical protein